MRRQFVLFLAVLAGPAPLAAQTDWYARAGATWASTLFTDEILDEITVRPAIAPTLAVGASLPIAPRYRAGIEASITSGGYDAREGGITTDLGTLRVATVLLQLEGPVVDRLTWRAGVGALVWMPSDETGIFQRGGESRAVVGAGADYRIPAFRGLDLVAAARWDAHQFSTDELRIRGYSNSQLVHRVGLSLGVARAR